MERAEIWPHRTLGGVLAGCLSATVTSMPRQARSRASVMPTGPPPTMSTLVFIIRGITFTQTRIKEQGENLGSVTACPGAKGGVTRRGPAGTVTFLQQIGA